MKPMEDEESNKTLSSTNNLVAEIAIPGTTNRRHLLSLSSQLQDSSSLEEEGINSTDDDGDGDDEKIESSREVGESSNEEIIKELKNIQRQNTITHYLLGASILVTLAWQLSEFSLIFRIKQSFNNPFKSIGGAIKEIINTTPQNRDHAQQHSQVIPPTYLPGLKIPDLPSFDTSTSTEDNDDD